MSKEKEVEKYYIALGKEHDRNSDRFVLISSIDRYNQVFMSTRSAYYER